MMHIPEWHYGTPFRTGFIRNCAALLTALVLTLTSPGMAQESHSFQPSPALAALFQQIENTMLVDRGLTFQRFQNEAPPVVVALSLGFAMQAQFRSHINQDREYWPWFMALEDDIEAYLEFVAHARGYRDTDGQPLAAEALMEVMREAQLGGNTNELAAQIFNYDPGTWTPSILGYRTDQDPAYWTDPAPRPSPAPPDQTTPVGPSPDVPTTGRTRAECEAQYCPMCQMSMSLLNIRAADAECSRCLQTNEARILACIGGGASVTPTPEPWVPEEGRCYVGASWDQPPRYSVACDGGDGSGTLKLSRGGFHSIVFGPASFTSCQRWLQDRGVPGW